jgi:hypothetical protein
MRRDCLPGYCQHIVVGGRKSPASEMLKEQPHAEREIVPSAMHD